MKWKFWKRKKKEEKPVTVMKGEDIATTLDEIMMSLGEIYLLDAVQQEALGDFIDHMILVINSLTIVNLLTYIIIMYIKLKIVM